MEDLNRLMKLAGVQLNESATQLKEEDLESELDTVKSMVLDYDATIDELDMMDAFGDLKGLDGKSSREIEQAFKEKFGKSSKEMLRAADEEVKKQIQQMDSRTKQNLKQLADHMTITPVGVYKQIKQNEMVYQVKSPKAVTVYNPENTSLPAASLPKSEEDWLQEMGVKKVKKQKRQRPRPMGPYPGYD